uniref:PHD-type domain-containing protein n=1 Tax=Lotharella globosa TaxID=91324 RepID=A0A7S3ZBA1_9EUKA
MSAKACHLCLSDEDPQEMRQCTGCAITMHVYCMDIYDPDPTAKWTCETCTPKAVARQPQPAPTQRHLHSLPSSGYHPRSGAGVGGAPRKPTPPLPMGETIIAKVCLRQPHKNTHTRDFFF